MAYMLQNYMWSTPDNTSKTWTFACILASEVKMSNLKKKMYTLRNLDTKESSKTVKQDKPKVYFRQASMEVTP